MTSGIYMVRHRESGKCYIGRSVNIEHRWHEHVCDAKKNRTNNMFHNFIRKYGRDAFEWKILVSAPARLHAHLEECFIIDMKTMKPDGFNLGGTRGGFASNELVALMPEDERIRISEMKSRVAKMGHTALREKRSDPEFNAEYLEIRRQGSLKREANIRAKRESDPEYAAQEKIRRSIASKKNPKYNPAKASETFKARMLADPEYAARVRANRAKAGEASRDSKLRKKAALAGGDQCQST